MFGVLKKVGQTWRVSVRPDDIGIKIIIIIDIL